MFAESRPRGSFAGWRLAAASIVLAAAAAVGSAETRPVGVAGPEADAAAQRMLEAVNDSAWQQTGAVRWSFRGNREHLWDRNRSLARVRWGKVEVLLDLTSSDSVVTRKGRPVGGRQGEELSRKAYAYWINDSFWLNPVSKVFDSGTVRSLVDLEDERQGLLVEYTSGGLTPGDAYLWIVGDDGLPTSWRMWTSKLPVGGARASWEEWTRLETGALISTSHALAVGKVVLGGVAGAASVQDLEPGEDPFLPLFASPDATPPGAV